MVDLDVMDFSPHSSIHLDDFQFWIHLKAFSTVHHLKMASGHPQGMAKNMDDGMDEEEDAEPGA